MSFPTSLNSFERQIVHELAAVLDLEHESCGQDKHRYIKVTKSAALIKHQQQNVEEEIKPEIVEELEETKETPNKVEMREGETEVTYTGAVKIHMDNLRVERQQRNTSKEFIQ